MHAKNTVMVAADGSPLGLTEGNTTRVDHGFGEPWVTMRHVCAHFQMSRTTVWRYVQDGMPVHPLGHRVRFVIREVHAWLEENERKRFAANGRAASLEEARKRIVMVPILEGMEIVANGN